MESIGFDINTIKSGYGIAPISPIVGDSTKCMGSTNDCIIYCGKTYYNVKYDVDKVKELIVKVPSGTSSSYGKPSLQPLRKQALISSRWMHQPGILSGATEAVVTSRGRSRWCLRTASSTSWPRGPWSATTTSMAAAAAAAAASGMGAMRRRQNGRRSRSRERVTRRRSASGARPALEVGPIASRSAALSALRSFPCVAASASQRGQRARWISASARSRSSNSSSRKASTERSNSAQSIMGSVLVSVLMALIRSCRGGGGVPRGPRRWRRRR